jgi:D-alanine-D-alanine ligase
VKVAVLFDDVDARPDATPDERGVLEAVEGALSALHALGHHVVAVPAGPDAASWTRTLEELSPHVVLNLCEGLGGRSEGEVLAARAMEALGLPLTGSPSEVLDLARRKDRVNVLLEARGLSVPPWARVSDAGAPASWTAFPAIVKPAAEDGSVGITQESVVADPEELARRLESAAAFAPLLIQAFVGTREINVGIVGREVLPLSEIVFSGLPPGHPPMVGYEAKWATGSPEDLGTRPVCPALLAPEVASRARDLALEVWSAVGGRGYGRVDLRLTEPDTLHVLEVNPNPDLAPSAGLARMATAAGWSYGELLERILAEAFPEALLDDGAVNGPPPPPSPRRPTSSWPPWTWRTGGPWAGFSGPRMSSVRRRST